MRCFCKQIKAQTANNFNISDFLIILKIFVYIYIYMCFRTRVFDIREYD